MKRCSRNNALNIGYGSVHELRTDVGHWCVKSPDGYYRVAVGQPLRWVAWMPVSRRETYLRFPAPKFDVSLCFSP
ncbi:MAG: hypothetical protein HC892_00355 [Saprospiraceae bacterium]|nr:hypothetical protein [Saprospiraceae bacterium]